TGGTGKTPHIEFIIRLLKDKYRVGVVSRGYGRRTKGFIVVETGSEARNVGDEPLQIKQNHPETNVAVGEQRIIAIPSLLHEAPDTQVILLDDAFQHRYVRPGMNILLTDYNHLFYRDRVLPAGNLREFKGGYRRADVIIVTKSPRGLSAGEKEKIVSEIKPREGQEVFFSFLDYGQPYRLTNRTEKVPAGSRVFFFAGIANASPVKSYLDENSVGYEIVKLADHYNYTAFKLDELKKRFDEWEGSNKILLTTQKGAVKLAQGGLRDKIKDWPLYVLPVEIGMNEGDRQRFSALLQTYIQNELSNTTDDE
ncbi:MAG TPA: tetraacyldisaccharide 4'-kinase, partial [Bacteroidia bacterium]|nr:tetraacyldisaccharide 4'-kinase [Bacteroidia bacterium]